MSNSVLFANNRNNGTTWPKKASVAFTPGMLIEIDGTTGFVEPATNSKPVLGVVLEYVDSASADYALNSLIEVSEATYNDQLYFTVSTGPATALMVGRYLAIDSASTGVVIAGISATVSVATPILVTKFISATLIMGKIAFRF